MSIPHHLLRNFDVELQDFYNIVVHEELGFQLPSYAERIEREFIRIHLSNEKRNSLRYVNISERCAYLLKYSPLLTSAFAYHFLEMVKNDDRVFDRPFQKRQLNLCCLGGGPASDVVALTKIIGELYLSKNYREPLHLKVTIIDVDGHWKTTSESVVRCIRRERSTFRAIGRMNIDFSFLQADLSKLLMGEVKEVIEKADLVTMGFFVSAVNLGSNACKLSCEKMITKIMTTVKSGSILFFMDAAGYDDLHFRQMDSAARELGDMEIIYEPCIEDLCLLSLNSVKRFLELYHRYFNRRILCWAYSFISYCAWRKSYFMRRKVVEEGILWSKLNLQKNNNELSKRKGAYKSELNKVTSRSFGQRNRNATNQLIPSIERGNVQSVHTSEIENVCEPELNSKNKRENAIRKISVAENIKRSLTKRVQERKTGENIQKYEDNRDKEHLDSFRSPGGNVAKLIEEKEETKNVNGVKDISRCGLVDHKGYGEDVKNMPKINDMMSKRSKDIYPQCNSMNIPKKGTSFIETKIRKVNVVEDHRNGILHKKDVSDKKFNKESHNTASPCDVKSKIKKNQYLTETHSYVESVNDESNERKITTKSGKKKINRSQDNPNVNISICGEVVPTSFLKLENRPEISKESIISYPQYKFPPLKNNENVSIIENVMDHKESIISSEGRGESAKNPKDFFYIKCPKCDEKITLDKNSIKDWLEREYDRDLISTAETTDITEKQSTLQQTSNNVSEPQPHSNKTYRNSEFDDAMKTKYIRKPPIEREERDIFNFQNNTPRNESSESVRYRAPPTRVGEIKESVLVNERGMQHEKAKTSTKMNSKENNDRKMEVCKNKVVSFDEKTKNFQTNTSEENRGGGSMKREPVTINESKYASKEKSKPPKKRLQKPRKPKSKDNVSQTQQGKNARDGQHDYTIIDEQNTKQEKGNVTPSIKTVTVVKKPSVLTAPLKKPRGIKKYGASCSNTHLDDNNEDGYEGTMSNKIISKETCACDSIPRDKTKKMINAPKVHTVPLAKPRELKRR